MELLNNLGISYSGDYISQGSIVDKCKKSSKLGIKNTEFIIRNDGKNMDFNNINNLYSGNIIFHMPTININQSNLKNVKDTLYELIKNDIKLVTIDASTLLFETYDWSTDEEQENYLKNMAKGIASLVTEDIEIAIENTAKDKDNLLFGKSASNISDLLVYTRNCLVEQFNYSREAANKKIGISLNINNLIDVGEQNNIENWFKVFYNDIKCIKVSNVEKELIVFNEVLDLVMSSELDVPLIYKTKEELEGIPNDYKKFEHLVKNKLEGKPLNFEGYQNIVPKEENYNFNSAQSGFTTAVIICMIILTAIIGVLMVIMQSKH